MKSKTVLKFGKKGYYKGYYKAYYFI